MVHAPSTISKIQLSNMTSTKLSNTVLGLPPLHRSLIKSLELALVFLCCIISRNAKHNTHTHTHTHTRARAHKQTSTQRHPQHTQTHRDRQTGTRTRKRDKHKKLLVAQVVCTRGICTPLRPAIPPLKAPLSFACSVASLSRSPGHYQPGHHNFRRVAPAECHLG